MKINKIITLILLASFNSAMANQVAYVKEELTVLMRAGPGKQYKVIGSIIAGDSIEIIEERNSFYKIINSNQSRGWIKSNLVSFDSSTKNKLNKLQQEYAQYRKQVESKQATKDQEIKDLQATNEKLKSDIDQKEVLNQNFEAKINEIIDDSFNAKEKQIKTILNKNLLQNIIALTLGLLLGLIWKKNKKSKFKFRSEW